MFPSDIRIESDERGRRAVHVETGEPIEIGAIEKMSKSKRNVVDPDEIIASYGADTARWFVLSDSPPDRDVIWTEEGVQGAARFVQRIWRLVNEIAMLAGQPGPSPDAFSEAALALRRASHRTLHAVDVDLERLAFNRCIAHVYTLANQISKSIDALPSDQPEADLRFALAEAGRILIQIVAPMMPHLGEECWLALGLPGLVAEADWPTADPALLADDTLTLPVQVNGRKRADVVVPADAEAGEIERIVRSLEAVNRAMEGREIKKVIVVPRRIVNVVG